MKQRNVHTGSCYLAITSEITEDFMCAVVKMSVYISKSVTVTSFPSLLLPGGLSNKLH
jgi:hypothetical protein